MSVSDAVETSVAPAALSGVTKTYGRGGGEIRALDQVTFELARGDFAVITGRSGSGKSTLLSLLGCLTTPTAGRVRLFGRDVAELNDAARSALRASRIGFVFQFTGLLPTLTAFDNVRLPSLFGEPDEQVPYRARDLLRKVGLGDRLGAYPEELSGGEQRRVAIARALLNEPELLLADEPTGDLDSETEAEVMEILSGLHREGLTLVVVTHNLALREYATRWLTMTDGRISEVGR